MPNETSEISRLERSDRLGLAAFRVLITLNAGAILAMLTYVGGANNTSQLSIATVELIRAMWCFLGGIVSILIALLVSYAFTASIPESRFSDFFNKWIVLTNAVLGIACLALFGSGVAFLILGIEKPL
ncbi:MAG: hypothetical protein ACJA06_000562 [Halocynthiibacter sp.]|jgi:hypothetical protein